MGYLNNQTLTVDAVLTKKGRELLAKGQNFFNITKFALADDEIDYTLWDVTHPDGSNYYGYAIEQLPILEPSINEVLSMRSKLICLTRDTVRIPSITVQPASLVLYALASETLTPQTVEPAGSTLNLNSTLGYTCILHNSDYATISGTGTGGPANYGDDPGKSVYVTGKTFKITGKYNPRAPEVAGGSDLRDYTKLTFIGNETGGLVEVAVTIISPA